MRAAPALLLLAFACDKKPARGNDSGSVVPPPRPDPSCEGLFGAPIPLTGLDGDTCAPEVAGDTRWTPQALGADELAWLRAQADLAPAPLLTTDPYAGPAPPDPDPDEVCAVHLEPDGYRLQTWPGPEAAAAGGGHVTHGGACGACSTLQDLAVYAEQADLTAPVRACGLEHLGDPAGLEACVAALGFTPACAQIWTFNVLHTQAACGAVCFELLEAPYHEPDGDLNACLACDEAESGPVFKAVAGRTRRNTGLPNALCRPCAEVWRVRPSPR